MCRPRLTAAAARYTVRSMERWYGTCVALEGLGVLLRGPSGSGKSDLALRLLDAGAKLVADDCVEIATADGRLIATAPAQLRGLLEVRGLGIIRVPSIASAPVVAVIDLITSEQVERLPNVERIDVLGIQTALFRIAASEPSAAAKVRIAVSIATGSIVRIT
jgi:HPr kinase/phosphorylase